MALRRKSKRRRGMGVVRTGEALKKYLLRKEAKRVKAEIRDRRRAAKRAAKQAELKARGKQERKGYNVKRWAGAGRKLGRHELAGQYREYDVTPEYVDANIDFHPNTRWYRSKIKSFRSIPGSLWDTTQQWARHVYTNTLYKASDVTKGGPILNRVDAFLSEQRYKLRRNLMGEVAKLTRRGDPKKVYGKYGSPDIYDRLLSQGSPAAANSPWRNVDEPDAELYRNWARFRQYERENYLEDLLKKGHLKKQQRVPVSYTHLTLPTICSV